VSFDSLCNSVSNTRLNVNYPLFLSDLNQTSIFSTDFRKTFKLSNSVQWEDREVPNSHVINQSINQPSSGSWVVPCGQAGERMDGFRNFANAPKNGYMPSSWLL